MFENKTNGGTYKWHIRFLMIASLAVLALLNAPLRLLQRATESTLLTLISALTAALAQTLALLAHLRLNNLPS